jgi:ATP-binding cassette, subfamily C, bacterial
VRNRSGNDREVRGRYESPAAYFTVVLPAVGRKAWLTLGLMIAGSLTEWVGLLLLVPLLALVGVADGQGMVGRIGEGAAALFGLLRLSPTPLTVLGVYVTVVSARALLQRQQTLAIADLEKSFVVYLRQRLYRAITCAQWQFLSRMRSSDLVHALTEQVNIAGQATNLLLSMIASVLIGFVYLLLALKLAPGMTMLACACGLALVLLLRKGADRARGAGGRMTRTTSRLLAAVTEHLGGIKTAKSYSAEDRNVALFNELSREVADSHMEAIRNYATVSTRFQVGSVALLSMLLYLAIGIWSLSAAEIILLLFLFSRLVPRFSSIQQNYQYLVGTIPAFSSFMNLVERCESEAEPRRSAAEPIVPQREIRLEGVAFRYGSDHERWTISDIDLIIPARRTTAIVGPSGAGKSTVADLVMGLLVPDEGQVIVDGTPLSPEGIHSWREGIGYVTQDTFLLHDSIRTNLLWAQPSATEDELWQALALAAADGFVRGLTAGLDTIIGDRGVLLSGGERQRLALARALLRQPSLLILDEATSALDSENERRIQRAIEHLHGRMTILVITHRLSTIRQADTIHLLEGGRLVESGSWEALVARAGRFAALCRAQGIGHDAPPAAAQALVVI